ncbi:hypothetical protein [Dactylosporangium salmoneum]|uniref:PPM-type phosphatase domain-containing protein n=1 Tax=Dactylosporangium salmoneum TaxID=53361 RepID=A0ABP5SN11_9ACTN
MNRPPRLHAVGLMAPKWGREPAAWQDCIAFDVGRGLFAVADGITNGYATADWAEALASGFVSGFPPLQQLAGSTAAEAFPGWLAATIEAWDRGASPAANHWAKELERQGTWATFAGLRTRVDERKVQWEALVVGDCCVCHVDGNTAKWVIRPDEFTDSPPLIGSRLEHRAKTQSHLTVKTGAATPGDLLLLTTDGIAEALIRHGEGINWAGLARMDDRHFGRMVSDARQDGGLNDDDVALLAVRIE